MGIKRTADIEEGDLSDFDANSGGCTADAAAAKNGSYGLLTANDTADANYARWSDPNQESPHWVDMWVKAPDNVSSAAKTFAYCYTSGTVVWRARMRYDSAYLMDVGVNDDGFSFTYSSDYTFTSGWHLIRIVWAAATGAGANNGYLKLYDARIPRVSAGSIDNDTFLQYVDIIDVGMPEGAWNDSGVGMRMDDIRWGSGVGPGVGSQGIMIWSKMQDFYDELKRGLIHPDLLRKRYGELFI